MATKKKATPTGDDKSQQLAAAAVGAGTELVQAQPQQKKDGEVLVEPDTEAARLEAEQRAAEEARLAAEAQADEEARLAAEAQAAEAARLEAEQQAAANQINADWLLGQFDVKAKSPAGFWRCEVQFLHSSPTRVFVVTAKADVPHDHSCEIPCCYLTAEQAQRVYHEPWLVCTEYEVMGA
ncbi:hypothetical protein [Aeromonas sp. L_1B5_3]|uniref:hypothetical protein n=1 Tax=Aeromonas sp. L_1B5_3 TaxID=1588629 RepID=UPI0005B6D8A0|nr:hypothetical protein [Aeromonas sp. L_1B5_3]KIQ84371.1 hypothetical protein RW26_02340 [Aeromonas sp. L_1B5_3]